MSDQLHLTGPEANVDREEFLLELQRAEQCDCTEIQKEMAAAFCTEPKKTVSEMSIEEVLAHKYTLESIIRRFRIHLQHTVNEEAKRRKTSGKLVIDADKKARPKPVPQSRQANNEDLKLAERIAEKKGIELDEALELIRDKMGSSEDRAAKRGISGECDYCDKPATISNHHGKACMTHAKEIKG